jgi:hypothetical protein
MFKKQKYFNYFALIIISLLLLIAVISSYLIFSKDNIEIKAQSEPVMNVTPNSLDFGDVVVGSGSYAEKTFTVENIGSGTLSGKAETSGPFSCESGCSYDLLAGQSQNVTIRFSPTAIGDANGSVDFSGGESSCLLTNNYHVETNYSFVKIPEINNFRIDTGGNPNYCSNEPMLSLIWDYTGETPQKAFEINIAGDINKTITTLNSSNTSGIKIFVSPTSNKLEVAYGGSYQIKARVQDQDENWSKWSIPPIPFTSTDHPWPDPNFYLTPTNPSVDQVASTTNTSKCHNDVSLCSSWLWTIPEGEFVNSLPTEKEPQLKFTSAGSKQKVSLKACDSTIPGACCTEVKEIKVLFPMPDWIEE